jgi:hypothetical protein
VPARGAARVEAGHRCGNAGLVDEDQVLWIDLPDPLAKDRPFLLDVGAILLAGARSFCAKARAAAKRGMASAG